MIHICPKGSHSAPKPTYPGIGCRKDGDSYPSDGNHGNSDHGRHAGGSGYGSGGSSCSSQEKHIQQVNSDLSGNLLGGAYHDGRKNRDKDDGINYQVKGIASQLNYYGFKDPKGIVLSDCALEDRDIYVLHQTLQYYPFNLTILDLSNNNLGLNSVHSIFYGMRGSQQGVVTHVCKQIKSINLSNNWLGDSSAKFIGEALEYGNVPSLKYLDVSGNQITPTGERYFAKALQSFMVKDIIITIRKYSTELEQKVIKPALKEFIVYASNQGIDTTHIATNKNAFLYMNDMATIKSNFLIGLLKCETGYGYLESGVTVDDLAFEMALTHKAIKHLAPLVCIYEAAHGAFVSPEGAGLAVKFVDLIGDNE